MRNHIRTHARRWGMAWTFVLTSGVAGGALGAAPAAPSAKPTEDTARSVTSVGVQASTPSVPAAIQAPRAVPPPVAPKAQSVRGDDVQIEGKLYSPQAVYLLNRTAPHFGRDAVVPHTLAIGAGTDLAPYRVRAAAVDAARPAGR